ncbi:hypothetical protein FQZ97_944360 [compost metagenome]
MGADREYRLAQSRLGRGAEEAELVGHLAVALHLQGAGTAGAAPGIELDAQQAQAVDAQSQGAFGEAGGVAQHEALGPFLGLGPGLALEARDIRLVGVAVVAVHVEVAGFQAQLAVSEEVGTGRQRQQAEEGEGAESEVWSGMHAIYLLVLVVRHVARRSFWVFSFESV